MRSRFLPICLFLLLFTLIAIPEAHAMRWYSSETGRWFSRDPIGPNGGANEYAFVGNSPIDYVDPFGLDFIAVGRRPVQGLGAFGHMSISYFEEPCPGAIREGTRFGPGDLGQGNFIGVNELNRWELLNYDDRYIRYRGRFRPGRPPGRRPRWEWVWISVVRNLHDGARPPLIRPTHYLVILENATQDQWNNVSQSAGTYRYAEHLPLQQIPRNWPNSRYGLPPIALGQGNNSNTFAFEMAAVVNRRRQAIQAFWNTPGNNRARPVRDRGRTPFLAPMPLPPQP